MRPVLGTAVVVYLAMAVVSVLIANWSGSSYPLVSSSITGDWMGEIGLGLALAAGILILSRLSTGRFAWARNLERELAEVLGPLDRTEIAALALFSGVCEEVFFRGALQPHLGYLITSVLFGLVHIGPSRTFLPWTIFAVGAGFLFGVVVLVSGALLPAIVAHVAVNWVNLGKINRLHCERADSTGSPAQTW